MWRRRSRRATRLQRRTARDARNSPLGLQGIATRLGDVALRSLLLSRGGVDTAAQYARYQSAGLTTSRQYAIGADYGRWEVLIEEHLRCARKRFRSLLWPRLSLRRLFWFRRTPGLWPTIRRATASIS